MIFLYVLHNNYKNSSEAPNRIYKDMASNSQSAVSKTSSAKLLTTPDSINNGKKLPPFSRGDSGYISPVTPASTGTSPLTPFKKALTFDGVPGNEISNNLVDENSRIMERGHSSPCFSDVSLCLSFLYCILRVF